MKAFYSGFEFRPAVEELLAKINSSLGLPPINVVWCGIQTAAINDKGRVYLADVADDARLSHATLLRYVGMGAHELCHHAYTDWAAISVAKNDPLLARLHNAVEDAYIERRAIREGLTGNIRELFTALIDGMVQDSLREVSDWANPGQYPYALAVYLRDHATTKVPLAQGLEPIFAEAANQFKSCANSADALRIAQWVLVQLKMLPKPKRKPEDRPGKPDGKPGEKPGQEGPQKAAGEPQKGEAPSTPDLNPGPAVAPPAKQDYRDVEPSLPSDSAGNDSAYSETDSLTPASSHVERHPLREIQVQVPAALRYNLKRLFDNSSRTEFGLRRQTGAVDVNALSRVGVTDKVFKRRSEIAGIDSAVVLVLDASGSMTRGGSMKRIDAATRCCAALLDALNRAQVATAVVAFNHRASVLKGFHESRTSAVEAMRRLDNFGGTNDFFAVRYAHKMLLARREQRKVCIVLTDGNGNPEATRRQVMSGEALGITTIGIGIQLPVGHVYTQHVNVQDVADLGNASFKQIKLAV